MTMCFDSLPNDIILELISYLNYDDMKRVAQLNVTLYSIFKQENSLNIINTKQIDKYLQRLSFLFAIKEYKSSQLYLDVFSKDLPPLIPKIIQGSNVNLVVHSPKRIIPQSSSPQPSSPKKLFFSGIKLIKYLQKQGVIAGGSAVYAMNDFVPIDSVGDIDVFINDPHIFIDVLNHLKEKYEASFSSINSDLYYNESDDEVDLSCYYEDEDYPDFLKENPVIDDDEDDDEERDLYDEFLDWKAENKKMSIVVAKIPECKISIQLVFQKYLTPVDVIKSFDLDYVQCAIYNNNSYRTDICRESHRSRTVIRGTEFPLGFFRLEKAQKKGFKTPIFGNMRTYHQETELYSIPKLKQLEYLTKRDQNIGDNFLLSEIIVSNFKYERCYRQKFYGKVKVQIGNYKSRVHFFTTKITVTKIDSGKIYIEPINFNGVEITRCCATTLLKLNMTYVVLVEICIVGIYKFLIHKIYDSALPVQHL